MKCLICGKEFSTNKSLKCHAVNSHKITAQEYYDKFFKKDDDGICVVCGKITAWNRDHYNSTCSVQCAAKNPERNKKIKETNLNRYGVENTFKIIEVKQKSIESIKMKKRNYKCLYCGKNTGIKKFCSEKCKLQYKLDGKSYNNRKQAKQTCIKKFNGKMNAGAWKTRRNRIETFEKEHNCTSTNKLYAKYGQCIKVLNLPKIMINRQNSAISNDYLPIIQKFVDNYNISNVRSSVEDIIISDLKKIYNGEIVHNTRKIIKPLELDIYIPDLKLAIEYNGTYWHSSKCNIYHNYHLNKSLLCREKGIRLIHLYEFESYTTQIELIKNLILGNDKFPKQDFNKNNLISTIPKPEIIYNESSYIIYGAGKLY